MYNVARTPVPTPPAAPMGALMVELPIPCSRCGYTLSGLRSDGACPECASPIAESIRGDLLKFCAPGYLRALHIGAKIAMIAVGTQLACTVLTMVPLLTMVALSTREPARWFQAFVFFTIFALPGLAGGAALAGWWLLTVADPARAGTPDDPKDRRVLRGIVWAEIGCWVILVGLGLGGVLSMIPPTVYIPMAVVAGLVVPVALAAHLVVSARFFRTISARLRTDYGPVICWYQMVAAVAGAAAVGLCYLGFWSGKEGIIWLCVLIAFLALSGLACVHLTLLNVMRVAARDALATQRRAPRP